MNNIPANQTGQIQGLSKICLQAGYIGQIALIGASAPPVIGSAFKRSDGRFELDASGLAGTSYRLQAAPALLPGEPWTNITSFQADPQGYFQLLDSRPASPQQFYRVGTP